MEMRRYILTQKFNQGTRCLPLVEDEIILVLQGDHRCTIKADPR